MHAHTPPAGTLHPAPLTPHLPLPPGLLPAMSSPYPAVQRQSWSSRASPASFTQAGFAAQQAAAGPPRRSISMPAAAGAAGAAAAPASPAGTLSSTPSSSAAVVGSQGSRPLLSRLPATPPGSGTPLPQPIGELHPWLPLLLQLLPALHAAMLDCSSSSCTASSLWTGLLARMPSLMTPARPLKVTQAPQLHHPPALLTSCCAVRPLQASHHSARAVAPGPTRCWAPPGRPPR